MEGEPSSGASKANPSANLSETPVRVKAVQSASYMEGNLDAARKAVMKDLGTTAPEVGADFFRTYLLPRLPTGVDINQVVNKLHEKHIKGNRWVAFLKDPKDADGSENVCFKSLETVAAAIGEVASTMTGKKQLLKFVQNPNDAPESSTRTSKSRPDGFFIRNSGPEGKFRWMDIALSAEYKKVENAKTKDDLWQDVRKVIWSMHHCMREDARRRFTYGLTIENRTMRMWFCSRTELLVSKPIDFMSEHHKVVHFFVAMMYAAEHEAGWDPTMQYVRKKNGKNDELELDKEDKPRLDIDVQDQDGTVVRYRTIRWLSDEGANGLRGRGTRVWEVCIFDNDEEGDERFALKDQYIDADRQREGMIIEELRNAKTKKSIRDIIDRSLLTVERHGDVYVEGMHDHTRNLMTRRGEPNPYLSFKLQQIPEDGETMTAKLSKQAPAGVGHYQTPEELRTAPAQKIYTYHPKVHYRIVFKEVCKPLREYTSLKEVFEILINAAFALVALHELGWVHRDISIGNSLGFVVNGVLYCKLSDLEYAKRMNDRSGHEIRTGTRSFMSVEVYDMEYCFLPSELDETEAQETTPPPSEADPDQEALDWLESFQRGNPVNINMPISKDGPIVPFRYNPLHDIESLWWVAIYFVFNKSVVKVGGEPPSMDASQRGHYFTQRGYTDLLTTSPQKRQSALGNERNLKNQIIYLHSAVRDIARKLNEIRKRLVSCYREAEKAPGAIHHKIGQDLLRGVFMRFFADIVDKNLREKDIQVDILPKDPRQYVEDPFEIPTQADGQDGVTDDNGPADDDGTEHNSDEGDQGSSLAALIREVSVGDVAEEATAKDGAQGVIVEDSDAERSVDKATSPSAPQISTGPIVEGRSTRPQRKRAPPVRYTGTEYNLKKGTTSKTASSSSAPTTATQAATGQSTSRTTSNTKATTKSSTKAKTKAKAKAKAKTKAKTKAK
ncbi:predicted protein [Postia placenta Mad-698-R]|uniref:Fungal-type protein kinase domain-containing protein n=1 Tax=Postia placenta MAD-698-R-SB12 TaxID=670580 RepID=A0A1X6MPC0_9APHY|nr:hypothetical protein POSPLADRAFT_1154914 [Postia placenta MAD-698-R-SB12]EED78862.1 predicted protein [Postia placenta Mad-698-R]OSX58042.1 hypothetical protein POSPLADRAFT_1154914 [Postia placenta MAD-698-R-SB12]